MTTFKHRPQSATPPKSLGRDRSGSILAQSRAFDAANLRRAKEILEARAERWGGETSLSGVGP